MSTIMSVIKGKLSTLYWTFITIGVIMLMLSVLIVWTEVILRFLVGLFVLLFAICLFVMAHKIHVIKKHLD